MLNFAHRKLTTVIFLRKHEGTLEIHLSFQELSLTNVCLSTISESKLETLLPPAEWMTILQCLFVWQKGKENGVGSQNYT